MLARIATLYTALVLAANGAVAAPAIDPAALTGDMRKLVVHEAPRAAGGDFGDLDGAGFCAFGFRGRDRGAEFLGHLVRALPQGNALARRAAGRAAALRGRTGTTP